MQRLSAALTRVENVLAAGTLVLAVAIAFLQIALRPLGVFLFWSEEAIIYLVIFSTFLGAVITLREREHVNVDIISSFLHARGKKWLALLAGTVTLVYLAVVGVFAWMLIFEPFSSSTVTPALKLPLWVVELAVPIGFTLMFVRAIEQLVQVARHGVPDNAVQEALEAEVSSIGLDVEDVRDVKRAGGGDAKGGDGAGSDAGRDKGDGDATSEGAR